MTCIEREIAMTETRCNYRAIAENIAIFWEECKGSKKKRTLTWRFFFSEESARFQVFFHPKSETMPAHVSFARNAKAQHDDLRHMTELVAHLAFSRHIPCLVNMLVEGNPDS